MAVEDFADLLDANRAYAAGFALGGLEGRAAKSLAVVTCMDSRIEPLAMLGLRPGDAKIIRNAGGRVTEETLRTLVLARWLLGVGRVMVVAHTNCRLIAQDEASIHSAIQAAGGPDTSGFAFPVISDLEAAVSADVERLRSSPYLPGLCVGGFVYEVESGRLRFVD